MEFDYEEREWCLFVLHDFENDILPNVQRIAFEIDSSSSGDFARKWWKKEIPLSVEF